jgi:antitoxin PrlF
MGAHSKVSLERMSVGGGVVIPKAVRDAAGLVAGGPVRVALNDRGEAVVLPADEAPATESSEQREARIRAAIDRIAGTVDFGFASTDEYMDFIRPHRRELP